MKTIRFKNGKRALIDNPDYKNLKRFNWSINTQGYVCRYEKSKSGKLISILMSREIMGFPKGFWIDHKNRNILDNRRCNLRVCKGAQNRANSRKSFNKTSKYKGVSWDSINNKWEVKIQERRLGRFSDERDAALMYDIAAQIIFGEFALINNI